MQNKIERLRLEVWLRGREEEKKRIKEQKCSSIKKMGYLGKNEPMGRISSNKR